VGRHKFFPAYDLKACRGVNGPIYAANNAFSKKLENLKAALSLHFAWYNFSRIHSTLSVTPAMVSGVSDRVWNMQELIAA
jgi:hypothetical protein